MQKEAWHFNVQAVVFLVTPMNLLLTISVLTLPTAVILTSTPSDTHLDFGYQVHGSVVQGQSADLRTDLQLDHPDHPDHEKHNYHLPPTGHYYPEDHGGSAIQYDPFHYGNAGHHPDASYYAYAPRTQGRWHPHDHPFPQLNPAPEGHGRAIQRFDHIDWHTHQDFPPDKPFRPWPTDPLLPSPKVGHGTQGVDNHLSHTHTPETEGVDGHLSHTHTSETEGVKRTNPLFRAVDPREIPFFEDESITYVFTYLESLHLIGLPVQTRCLYTSLQT